MGDEQQRDPRRSRSWLIQEVEGDEGQELRCSRTWRWQICPSGFLPDDRCRAIKRSFPWDLRIRTQVARRRNPRSSAESVKRSVGYGVFSFASGFTLLALFTLKKRLNAATMTPTAMP